MRTSAGIKTEHAARLLNVPRTNVPNMESGRSGLSPDRVRTLAANYSCTDEEFVEALAVMAAEREKGWWEEYRGQLPDGFLDIAEMEWHSARLRITVSVHLPGLLQTEDHARAVFKAVIPPLLTSAADTRLAHRVDRQQVLDRPEPPALDVILHEAALRMEFGGSSVAKRQLEHLLHASEREAVTIRVIPFKAGGFPGAGQSVVYAESSVPRLDTVELDSTHGPEFIDTEAQLGKYRAHFDAAEAVALAPAPSRDFIRALANGL
ncbi:DUF5753 domain-containing protein [Streptomyces geranii]|uniref:DUF5753 domain-containing protein n=1 Tax=Streptomyces geranii TaxID=2058923 RepID=UPI002FCDBE1F